MRARILTLRFSPTLGGFDNSALRDLVRERDLLDLREHVVAVDGQPCVVCVALWQDRAVAEPATRGPTEPATDQAAPAQRHGPATPVSDLLQGLDDAQRAQFARIRSWRARTAHQEGVPPYVILTNRQLVEIDGCRSPQASSPLPRWPLSVSWFGGRLPCTFWPGSFGSGPSCG